MNTTFTHVMAIADQLVEQGLAVEANVLRSLLSERNRLFQTLTEVERDLKRNGIPESRPALEPTMIRIHTVCDRIAQTSGLGLCARCDEGWALRDGVHVPRESWLEPEACQRPFRTATRVAA